MKILNKVFAMTILLFIFSACTSNSTSSTDDSKKMSTEISQEESSSSYYEGQVVDDIKKTSDYLSFNRIIDVEGNEYTPPEDIEKLVGKYQFIDESEFDRRIQYFITVHKDGSFITNRIQELKPDSDYDKQIYFDKTNQLQQTNYYAPDSILKTGVIVQAYGKCYLQPLEQLEIPLTYNQEGKLIINYLNPSLYYEKEAHNGIERTLDEVRKNSDDTIAISDSTITVNEQLLTKIDEQNEFAKRSVFQFEKYVQKNKTKFQQINSLNDLLIISNSTTNEKISAVKPETLKGYTVDNKQPKLKYAFTRDADNGTIFYTATDGENLYKGVNSTDPIEWESTPLFE